MTSWQQSIRRRTESPLFPVVLLALAALSLFVFQNHEDGFEWGARGFLSSQGMALSRNLLNGDHPFFMYHERKVEAGKITYEAYNRFPVVPFLLVAGVIRPFEPHLAAEVFAGRQLMNVFLVLALAVAFLVLKRLTGNPVMSAALALTAFSSYYVLFFSDMIYNDIPALFGFLLSLHLALESRAGSVPRWKRIAIPLIAVCLGWQPLGVFAVWAALDVAALLRGREDIAARAVRLPSVRAAALAFAAAALLLGGQLMNEWRIVGGSFTSTPTVHSALWRLGAQPDSSYAEYATSLRWDHFLVEEMRRGLSMLAPLVTLLDLNIDVGSIVTLPLFLLVGAALVLALRAVPRGTMDRSTALLLCLPGLVWSVPMRHFTAFHAFQALFHIGFVLCVYSVLARFLDARVWRGLAFAAAVLFVICVIRINQGKSGVAADVNAITTEFQAVRDHLPKGARVYLDGDRYEMGMGHHAVDFYLAGTFSASPEEADFAISKDPNFPGRRLTGNAKINLFARR